MLEEDTTQDSEVEHTAERVDYLAVQGDGGVNGLTHDSNNGPYTQAWDVKNRIITVTNAPETTVFDYDADGRHTKTTKPNGVVTYTPFRIVNCER